eukprot:14148692-Alexandrium_andersonii.AAC.1
MTDRAIFDVDLGDVDQFRDEVADWRRFWKPDDSACRTLGQCPLQVLAVVLSRPSGWVGCQSISKTLATSARRHLNVYRGTYDRNEEHETWANER